MRRVGRLVPWLAAVAAAVLVPAGSSAPGQAPDLAFYPQAGVLWRDVFVNNFVDLDPGPGVRDFACGSETYDGHTGIDSDVRSFRETDIGVPVFAALDGRVISVQDGNPDRNWGALRTPFDNHVVLEHGPGRFTIYGHLRRGIRLRRDQQVRAGQQLGWTASSGNSTWPHLHFTSRVGDEVSEPFAGPCRAGPSGWTEQPPLPAEPYVADVAVSARSFAGDRGLPHDRAVRTGTFVRGTRNVFVRVEVGTLRPVESVALQLVRPGGATALERSRPLAAPFYHGLRQAVFALRPSLNEVGAWRMRIALDGVFVEEAPVRVVAHARQARNRPPSPVSVRLHPAAPTAGDAVACRVETSLVTEDPDFEIVRYRYRWTVGGRVVRAVTSAALSDMVAKGVAVSGAELACSVTPSDGRLTGPTAVARVTVG